MISFFGTRLPVNKQGIETAPPALLHGFPAMQEL